MIMFQIHTYIDEYDDETDKKIMMAHGGKGGFELR